MSLFVIGCILLRLLCLAFFIVLVMRLAAGFRRAGVDAGLAALERRYAKGGLSEADFRHMREVLEA